MPTVQKNTAQGNNCGQLSEAESQILPFFVCVFSPFSNLFALKMDFFNNTYYIKTGNHSQYLIITYDRMEKNDKECYVCTTESLYHIPATNTTL